MTSVKRAESSRAWPVWVGDGDRLRRVLSAVRGAFPDVDQEALDHIALEERRGIEDPGAQTSPDPELWVSIEHQKAQDRRREVMAKWNLEVVSTEYDLVQTFAGGVDDVMADIDPAVVRGLRVRIGYPYEAHITMSFTRSKGVSYTVEGSDPGWVRQTKSVLDSEVRRAVPKWEWLRRDIVALPVFSLVGTLAAGIALLPVIAREASIVGDALLVSLVLCIGALAGIMLNAATWFLIPGFELLPQGQDPKGRRVLGFIGAAAVEIVLGIIINFVTR